MTIQLVHTGSPFGHRRALATGRGLPTGYRHVPRERVSDTEPSAEHAALLLNEPEKIQSANSRHVP